MSFIFYYDESKIVVNLWEEKRREVCQCFDHTREKLETILTQGNPNRHVHPAVLFENFTFIYHLTLSNPIIPESYSLIIALKETSVSNSSRIEYVKPAFITNPADLHLELSGHTLLSSGFSSSFD